MDAKRSRGERAVSEGAALTDGIMEDRFDYELVIQPTNRWFDLNLKELWRYRDLLLLLVHRDFTAKYKQTILGPAWFVLQPLITTLIFTVVFSSVAKIPTGGAPPILFYLSGLLGWNYFAQTFQNTSGTLVNNAGVFGKVYFPRLVVPLSVVISNLLAFVLQFFTVIVAWIYFRVFTSVGHDLHIGASALWLPVVVLHIAALSLGTGLWFTAITTKYRDFAFLTGFIVQIWMYATPVIYPLSAVPERWRWVALSNPMTAPVEMLRRAFLGGPPMEPQGLWLSVGTAATLLISGALAFNRVEKTFVDTV